MSQRIEKTSTKKSNYFRGCVSFKRARDAFGSLLDSVGIGSGDCILMPGYIGWSSREGSGVFDPISERGITPIFYHMGRNLQIDEEDCRNKIDSVCAKLLLIIHYFGFVDSASSSLINYARSKGLIVLEDAAHAILSDRIGGACGNKGDYTLYSLHKMLPLQEGGMLVSNGKMCIPDTGAYKYEWEKYDLVGIAKCRVENYQIINQSVKDKNIQAIQPLYRELESGIIPQTYPVVLHGIDRDKVYTMMNERGWGVVSLYHTMIDELHKNPEFEDECWLSKHIINLPVHQDVNKELIGEMVNDFIEIVNLCRIAEV